MTKGDFATQKRAAKADSSFACFKLCVSFRNFVVGVKEHRNAPYTCNGNENVNYSRKKCCCASRYPCYRIEREQTDKSPVQCAYYGYDKCNFICYHHFIKPRFYLWISPLLFSDEPRILFYVKFSIRNQRTEYCYRKRFSAFREPFFLFWKRMSVKYRDA